ncbi:MAG: hypothetical protein AB2693_34885 [Candidatus Thiodiazotropha sp.]
MESTFSALRRGRSVGRNPGFRVITSVWGEILASGFLYFSKTAIRQMVCTPSIKVGRSVVKVEITLAE